MFGNNMISMRLSVLFMISFIFYRGKSNRVIIYKVFKIERCNNECANVELLVFSLKVSMSIPV